MKKALLALALGGAVGIAVKAAADRKKKHFKMKCSDYGYPRSEKEAVSDEIYKLFPEGVVIESAVNFSASAHTLGENELKEGELSASIYKVGCYTVRIAERVYREEDFEPSFNTSEDKEIRLEGKTIKQGEAIKADSADIPPLKSKYNRPAAKDELEEYRNAVKNPCKAMVNPPLKYQKVQEVTAAYMDGEFKNVCQTMYAKHGMYTDTLTFMGMIKRNKSVPDSDASLLIGREYVGNSFSIEYYYIFSLDGYIRYFDVGPDPESWNAKWDWNG